MDEHPKLTEDAERNRELVAEYLTTDDPGDAFTEHVRSLGFRPPDRPEVGIWGLCVIYDDDEVEWLAWDAESVRRPADFRPDP